jgi:hypothetical protein
LVEKGDGVICGGRKKEEGRRRRGRKEEGRREEGRREKGEGGGGGERRRMEHTVNTGQQLRNDPLLHFPLSRFSLETNDVHVVYEQDTRNATLGQREQVSERAL